MPFSNSYSCGERDPRILISVVRFRPPLFTYRSLHRKESHCWITTYITGQVDVMHDHNLKDRRWLDVHPRRTSIIHSSGTRV